MLNKLRNVQMYLHIFFRRPVRKCSRAFLNDQPISYPMNTRAWSMWNAAWLYTKSLSEEQCYY